MHRVWRYLVDPAQVVGCVPGAELTSVEDARTFKGRVKAKVGPVSASYAGVARLTELDDAAHTLTLAAEGKELGGSGSATVTMRVELHAVRDGGVEVHVTATVDIVGRVMQFGRGMVEMVSRQLFADFVSCVRSTLEQPEVDPSADAGSGAPRPVAAPLPVEPMRPVQSLLRGFRLLILSWLGRKRRA